MKRRAWRAVTAVISTVGLTVGGAALGATAAPNPGRGGQPVDPPLYRCADDGRVEAEPIGLTLCDAAATDTLADRAGPDNLQTRPGALVIAVAAAGPAGQEGMLANDLIFRVAGSDVAGSREAAARLAAVGRESDTVVNFLRAGRPYRVKLRR